MSHEGYRPPPANKENDRENLFESNDRGEENDEHRIAQPNLETIDVSLPLSQVADSVNEELTVQMPLNENTAGPVESIPSQELEKNPDPSLQKEAGEPLVSKGEILPSDIQPQAEWVSGSNQQTYERPSDDPSIREIMRTIDERSGREYAQYVRGQWGPNAQRGALSNSGGSSRSQIEWRVGNRAWDDFIQTNPDMAEKYKGKFKDIDEALERRALREQRVASTDRRPQSVSGEAVPTQNIENSVEEEVLKPFRQTGLEPRFMKIENGGTRAEN